MDIELTPEAQAGFDQLPTPMQARVLGLIERLEDWPRFSGITALRHQWKGHHRLRTGKYRMIFHVRGEVIIIDRIDDRKDVY